MARLRVRAVDALDQDGRDHDRDDDERPRPSLIPNFRFTPPLADFFYQGRAQSAQRSEKALGALSGIGPGGALGLAERLIQRHIVSMIHGHPAFGVTFMGYVGGNFNIPQLVTFSTRSAITGRSSRAIDR